MNTFALLVILLSISVCGGKSITKDVIRGAAKKCCTQKQFKCCVELMTFGKPIGCGFEESRTLPNIAYTCIQDHLFANEPEKKVKLDDSRCCEVFAHDANDSGRQCESTCKSAMSAPSLSAEQKIQKIQQCTLLENPLFNCFTECRKLRSDGIRIEVLQFNEYCNITGSASR